MGFELPEGKLVKDLSPADQMRYHTAHPRPQTLKKYYRFADEYLANGFHRAEAWQVIYPNQNFRTATKYASMVMNYNDQIINYINEGKKKITEQFDLAWCTQRLAEIVDKADAQDKDKIAAVKSIQSAIFKLKELEAKEKEDNTATINVNLVE